MGIDLSTMQKRLNSRTYYKDLQMFTKDFMLIINNCKTYNNKSTSYYKYGTD